MLGFPVIWVRSNGRWYTSIGLNTTLALRNALQQALMNTQNQVNSIDRESGVSCFSEKKGMQTRNPFL